MTPTKVKEEIIQKNFEHKIAEKMAEIEKHQISLWSYLKFMGAKVRFI